MLRLRPERVMWVPLRSVHFIPYEKSLGEPDLKTLMFPKLMIVNSAIVIFRLRLWPMSSRSIEN